MAAKADKTKKAAENADTERSERQKALEMALSLLLKLACTIKMDLELVLKQKLLFYQAELPQNLTSLVGKWNLVLAANFYQLELKQR
jgi:hypothetical protein